LDQLAKAGRIRIDDQIVADPDKRFKFAAENGAGLYSLAE
jgi:hypothetical protein